MLFKKTHITVSILLQIKMTREIGISLLNSDQSIKQHGQWACLTLRSRVPACSTQSTFQYQLSNWVNKHAIECQRSEISYAMPQWNKVYRIHASVKTLRSANNCALIISDHMVIVKANIGLETSVDGRSKFSSSKGHRNRTTERHKILYSSLYNIHCHTKFFFLIF